MDGKPVGFWGGKLRDGRLFLLQLSLGNTAFHLLVSSNIPITEKERGNGPISGTYKFYWHGPARLVRGCYKFLGADGSSKLRQEDGPNYAHVKVPPWGFAR